MRGIVLIVLVGCGRIAFDPRHDGAMDGQGDAAVDPDLLFHLSFDNGLIDDARGHSVTCLGQCPLLTAGHVGTGSAIFSGNNCLEIADASDLHPSTFTFALWGTLTTPSQNVDLMARPLHGATTSNDNFEIWAQPNNAVIIASNGLQSNNTGLDITLWHHYAGVIDGTTLTTYVDGATNGSNAVSPTSYGPDSYLVGCDRDIGALSAQLNSGNLDDVRFYGRALTSAEINALAKP